MSNDWTWKLTDAADTQLDKLDPTAREQITGKLEEIVTNEWREPPQYVEPLQNAPHSKLRVGGYRVAVRLDRDQQITWVLNIHKREGAYTADDWIDVRVTGTNALPSPCTGSRCFRARFRR